MAKKIKLRAKSIEGGTLVKAIMTHPMETGTRKDKDTGEVFPQHFIQEVVCKHNGEQVASMEFSPTVSKNPFIEFEFDGGAAGDSVELSWTDNKGETGSGTTQIK
jgi:sulfur-oxidizing protein SoxZ